MKQILAGSHSGSRRNNGSSSRSTTAETEFSNPTDRMADGFEFDSSSPDGFGSGNSPVAAPAVCSLALATAPADQ
ncbi:hypothetical protein SLEP1_g7677 [Rubroshorea leprosula]|uniref:Uncharacterized protein n=1 Tax=Rubroshorea leprosula TaxID=152421 RepID=A0AAV5HZ84_9ROSI|nr:hypothetical protein SLEP1_g7677 [Rubroshorea leprosula]